MDFIKLFTMKVSFNFTKNIFLCVPMICDEIFEGNEKINFIYQQPRALFDFKSYVFQSVPPIFWYQVHKDLMALKKLMTLINNNMTEMILIASFNNLFYICTQLFYGFRYCIYPIFLPGVCISHVKLILEFLYSRFLPFHVL